MDNIYVTTNKYNMNKELLTQTEITAIKELIYNEIDNNNGIEYISEELKSVLKKLQMLTNSQLWILDKCGISTM